MCFSLPLALPELADGSPREYLVRHGFLDYGSGVGEPGLGIGVVGGIDESIWRTAGMFRGRSRL